jgi:hypothetical protein
MLIFLWPSLHAQEYEGVEKGDIEFSFFGMIMGTGGFAVGTFYVQGGYYITDKLVVGAGPGVTVTGYETVEFDPETFETNEKTELDASLSLQMFTTYNFFTDRPRFPYAKAVLGQSKFDKDDFFCYTSLEIGGGYKWFFTDRIAWDSSLTFGLGFSSPVSATITFLTGLTFKL